MPLYKGNTRLGLYLGIKKIGGIYEGLTPLYTSFSWQEWYNEYIYNALIPTTLNNKQAQDKAKLVEIQGNSCVVNQGLRYGRNATYEQNGFTLTQTSNGVIRVNGTSTSDNWFHLTNNLVMYLGQTINAIDYFSGKSNHVFLLYGMPSNTPANVYMGFVDSWGSTRRDTGSGVILNGYPLSYCQLAVKVYSGLQLNNFDIRPQIVDLTQQFPFDTPTTLTDNRVKRIIEQGYIPYNNGEIKDSVVGEVVANGYNLFDGELENKLLVNGGGDQTSTNRCCSWFIKVSPLTSYTLESNSTTKYIKEVHYYSGTDNLSQSSQWIDKITVNNNTSTFTTPSSCSYIRFSVYKTDNSACSPSDFANILCLHFTGTRTGYADYIPQQYLPSEYQEVEYLESTGTQAINTSVNPTQNTKIEIDYLSKKTVGESFQVPAGQCYDNTGIGVNFYIGSQNNLAWRFGNASPANDTGITVNQNDRHKYTLSYRKFVVDNQEFTDTETWQPTNDYPIYIFARNYMGSSRDAFANGKLYSCKIYDNNILIRNFIPCYRKSDNVAGLYDLVNNLFYTNNGTGTFIVGKKVNNNTMIKLPAPLDLGGVNTAHNTFAITKTNYVFTRNVWNYTFTGSETIGYNSSNKSFYVIISSSVAPLPMFVGVSTTANALFDGAKTYSRRTINNDLTLPLGLARVDITNINRWEIRNLTYDDTTISGFTSWLTGKNIQYGLATPQVINIPRKHLGVVDLGSIVWEWSSSAGTWVSKYKVSNITIPSSASSLPNMFCGKYMTNISSSSSVSSKDNIVFTGNQYVYIKDTTNLPSTLTATQVQNLLTGIYLFYETQDEVQDFNDEMFIQSGGTVNGNQPILPLAYQEVEYIESQGAQAIDTGIYNSDDNSFEIDFAIGDTTANRNYVIGGASSNPTVDRTQFSYSANAFIGWGENSHTSLTLNVDTNKHKILMNKSNFVLDDAVVYTPNNHIFLGTDKTYLFGMVYSNSVGSTTIFANKLKIYKAKIWNNGTLIRNFIPCYNRSTNEIGMFDLVTNQFFGNIGTGSFLKGRDVTNTKTCEVLPNVILILKCK